MRKRYYRNPWQFPRISLHLLGCIFGFIVVGRFFVHWRLTAADAIIVLKAEPVAERNRLAQDSVAILGGVHVFIERRQVNGYRLIAQESELNWSTTERLNEQIESGPDI